MRSALRKSLSFRRRRKKPENPKEDGYEEREPQQQRQQETAGSTTTASTSSGRRRSSDARKLPPHSCKSAAAAAKPTMMDYLPSSYSDDDVEEDETRTNSPTSTTANLPMTPATAPDASSHMPPHSSNHNHQNTEIHHIAKAAEALDTAGNELFEKGDFQMAMASYARALKLKKLVQSKQKQHEKDERRNSRSTSRKKSTRTNDTHPVATTPPPKSTTTRPTTPTTDHASSSQHVDTSTSHLLASVATSINNIGYLRQRAGATPDEIMKAYQDSLAIKRDVLGDRHLSVGKTMNNLASVYFSTRRFEAALESYQEALRILQEHLGDNALDVATVHSNMGDVHMAQRDGVQARECYQRALSIRWEQLGERDAKVIRLLEKVAAIDMEQDLDGSMLDGPEEMDEDELDDAAEDAFHDLHAAVQKDLTFIDKMERKMALDMVKDKLKILRAMRDISRTVEDEQEEDDAVEEMKRSPKLSPLQRREALDSVKERLARLKESRVNIDSLSSGRNNMAVPSLDH